eukprot:PLAT10803.1.p2 GENE.PLAT10803.1~~PLAT10803.1.p2  ORF type:complete len:427 (+),score=248.56 PLAT10803.1:115-1395(+)
MAASITCKLALGDDLRRVTVPAAALDSAEALRDFVGDVFKAATPPSFAIKYCDEDGDLVTIAESADIAVAIASAGGKPLRLTILATEAAPAGSPAAPADAGLEGLLGLMAAGAAGGSGGASEPSAEDELNDGGATPAGAADAVPAAAAGIDLSVLAAMVGSASDSEEGKAKEPLDSLAALAAAAGGGGGGGGSSGSGSELSELWTSLLAEPEAMAAVKEAMRTPDASLVMMQMLSSVMRGDRVADVMRHAVQTGSFLRVAAPVLSRCPQLFPVVLGVVAKFNGPKEGSLADGSAPCIGKWSSYATAGRQAKWTPVLVPDAAFTLSNKSRSITFRDAGLYEFKLSIAVKGGGARDVATAAAELYKNDTLIARAHAHGLTQSGSYNQTTTINDVFLVEEGDVFVVGVSNPLVEDPLCNHLTVVRLSGV